MEENHKENTENKTPSASLNVLCAICSEFFRNTDIIYSTTKCGHVFHRQCLYRWLSRSNTCPQCRARLNKNSAHRLYLNFNEPTDKDNGDAESVKGFDWVYVDERVTEKEVADIGLVLGLDKEGNAVYAARAPVENDLIPGGYVPRVKGVFAPYDCQSYLVTEGIEILDISNDDAEYKWLPAANGQFPENALETGYTETGETLYIARALYNKRIRFGKLHPSHGCAYMPYKTKEAHNNDYEVLIRIPKTTN